MPQDELPPTDYRKLRRSNDRNLLILVIVVLVVVGDGLIGLIWGWPAAITGGICLIGGAALIISLWLLLSVIERWVEE
jgi:hypothetical protein